MFCVQPVPTPLRSKASSSGSTPQRNAARNRANEGGSAPTEETAKANKARVLKTPECPSRFFFIRFSLPYATERQRRWCDHYLIRKLGGKWSLNRSNIWCDVGGIDEAVRFYVAKEHGHLRTKNVAAGAGHVQHAIQGDRDVLGVAHVGEVHLVLIGSEIETGVRRDCGVAYHSSPSRRVVAGHAGVADAGQTVGEGEDQGVIARAGKIGWKRQVSGKCWTSGAARWKAAGCRWMLQCRHKQC